MHDAYTSDDSVEQTAPVWAVFGDLMAGLLGAFVLILVGVIGVQMELTSSLEAEVKKRQQEEQRRIALEKALAIPLASGRVTLNNGKIGISGSVLFSLNSDQLQPEGRQLLKSLAPPLAAYLAARDELLMVSGFTDDRPVRDSNSQFHDNWELSAQRALTVTRTLIHEGIPASTLFAAASAPNSRWPPTPKPAAARKTAAWKWRRCRNRRVPGMSRVTDVAASSGAAIAALRAQGADQHDPVRFRFIEALARRTEAQQGEARQVLEERLAAVLQAYTDALAQPDMPRRQSSTAGTPSPLAALIRRMPTPVSENCNSIAAPNAPDGQLPRGDALTSAPMPAPAAELKSLHYFRDAWAKLSIEQHLAQALAQAPENAGPLNSHRLVLSALERMRDVSPGYLAHFIGYAEGLLWLEQVEGVGKR